MNKLLLGSLLFVFASVQLSQADLLPVKQASDVYIAPAILQQQDLQNLSPENSPFPEIKLKITPPKTHKQTSVLERFAAQNLDDMYSGDSAPMKMPSEKKEYAAFLSAMSPDYKIKRNPLGLTPVSVDKRKRSIMFVFFMNDTKLKPKGAANERQRAKLHVMWPGSKKLKIQQTLIKNEYPIDVSIANANEGYSSKEWNLVLPAKKPRELLVSLLWSF